MPRPLISERDHPNHTTDDVVKIRRYTVLCALLWTILLAGLFAAYVVDNRKTVSEIGHSMAQVAFEKDVLFRRWAARHGGVYVPKTAVTPPNSYLDNIPERDITTPSGRTLTLVNPAYMSRQLFELSREQPDMPQGHITSLNPIRPGNAPDLWEERALRKMEQGAKEVSEVVQIHGHPFIRFMRPLVTEEPCLRCHAAQGYKEGDGRGGISITLPLTQIRKAMDSEMEEEAFIHSFIWLVGLGLISFGAKRISRTTLSLHNERNSLSESELRFRSLADTAPVLIWMSDHTKGCTYFNKGWCDFTGRDLKELSGNGWVQDVHPNDLEGCINIYESAFDARQPFSMEYRLRRQDGEYRWLQDNGVPRWMDTTVFLGYIGSCFDITERKLAEVELRESKEHYRAIIDAFDGQIYICSQDYYILFMNEKMIDRIGHNAVGESCFEALHDLDSICPWCVNERVFNGETVRWEVQSPKDGRWYYVVNTPIHNEDGTISKQAMIQDITDRKLAEMTLQINEAKQRAMIENIIDVIAIVNQDGIIRYISPNIEKLFGWKPDDVAGKAIWGGIHPDDLEPMQKHFANLLTDAALTKSAECRYRCRDDNYTWIRCTGVNLLNDQEIAGVLLSYHDISERKQAEKERMALEQQFHQAQKLESLGVLAGGIAHDFNNILTVILGHCYLASEDCDLDPSYKVHFQQIESAGNRAADLCRQMLTYAGKSPLVQTRVNLWLLVNEVLKMLQSAIKKNISFELDLKERVPEIMGDSGQLQQIIMNLIINAVEAIGDKKGTIRVVLKKTFIDSGSSETDTFGTAIQPGRYTCLEVTDTGSGMDEEIQKRIFEPFYTTKFTGRGLGMSAIRGIVSSHEGILQLTSTPGVGTTFKVCFPVPEVSDHAESDASASHSVEKASGNILLVEDEQTLRDMGKALLEAMGFSTLTAHHGGEAVEIYRKRSSEIDVILLDLIMPEMGGVEAYQELRKISSTLPIIICSGFGVESASDVIEHDPHAGFVHKPYKPGELRNELVRMMVGHTQ